MEFKEGSGKRSSCMFSDTSLNLLMLTSLLDLQNNKLCISREKGKERTNYISHDSLYSL